MDSVKIYLHDKEKFLFFQEQDQMPNNLKIDRLDLQLGIQIMKHYDLICNLWFQKRCRYHIYFEEGNKKYLYTLSAKKNA